MDAGLTSKTFYKNPEVIFIIIYNLITLLSFTLGQLEPIFVLWAYFLQSLYIGAKFWFMQIIAQYKSPVRQWPLVLFFPVHFGGFHLVYFFFLVVMGMRSNLHSLGSFLLLNVAVLFVQFVIFAVRDASKTNPQRSVMYFFAPYIRIIPMHLIILLGLKASKFGIHTMYLFIALKILADLITFKWSDAKTQPAG
jgi:hypothetical protein